MSPLFNRNKKTTIAELEEYYSNQGTTDSSARAWAMAVLSLLITVAIILALFFAGRWLWRVIDGDDDNATTTTTQQEGVTVLEDGTLSGDLSLLNNESSNTQSGGSVSVDTGNSAGSDTSEGVVSEEAASTSESNEDTVAAGVNSANESDDDAVSTSEIPNTGAGSILVAIPAATAVAGYAVSRRRLLNR